MKKPKVISLFSGAGGLDLGFQKADSEIVYANDIQEDFCDTYRKNVGPIGQEDITKVDVSEIPDGDVVIGGFPCLGFTIGRGRWRKRDPKEEKTNFLYQKFLRVIEAKRPRLFLMENVPGIKAGAKFKEMFNQIIKECEMGGGYNVIYDTLDAVHWGVPQHRRRIFILGVKNGTETKIEADFFRNFPRRTHVEEEDVGTHDYKPPQRWVTVRDAIGDLPLEWCDDIPNHVGTKHKVKIKNYPGNRLLDWGSPSPTITGRGSLTGGPVIHPHPNLHRRLTVRECARLQSFPDDFVFQGSPCKGYAQVGNAVPPLFAFRIAQVAMKLLGFEPRRYKHGEWKLPWAREIPQLEEIL